MLVGLEKWANEKVRDSLTGILGTLSIRSSENDIHMHDGGTLHNDEVSISGSRSEVYFGSAKAFDDKYSISDDGTISMRGGLV